MPHAGNRHHRAPPSALRRQSQIPCATSTLPPLHSAIPRSQLGVNHQSGTLMFMTRMPFDLSTGLPGLLGFDHVGIAVPDLDAAINFYRDLLGLQVVHREENLDQQVAEAMLTTGENGARGNQLQLLMPLAEDSVLNRFLMRRGSGLHHVAYAVSDVRSASSTLRKCGIRVLYDSPRAGTRGSQINFVHPKDTGGVLLELVEHAAADPQNG
jgi:methylmalonyl-CoA/ethylmalonyl-CoA epimerase